MDIHRRTHHDQGIQSIRKLGNLRQLLAFASIQSRKHEVIDKRVRVNPPDAAAKQ
jgi:hypothetical protein